MVFWGIALALTAAVAAILLGAARATVRASAPVAPATSDMAVYRDQLKEIDRDVARGILGATEAEAVRIEVSRRLLEADRRVAASNARARDGHSRLTIGVVALLVGGGSLALYAWLGAPGYGDMPINARLAAAEEARNGRPDQASAEVEAAPMLPAQTLVDPRFAELMDRLRAAVKERPDDVQGLTLLSQNEARLGNFAAARMAQEKLVAVKGENATDRDRSQLLDLMVLAAGGYVSPEAEGVARSLLEDFPDDGTALYYLGLLEAQTGRADRAFAIWRRLLETSPPNAPWMPVIREQIADVAAAAGVSYSPPTPRGPSEADVAAAEDMTAEERDVMIRGMVSGLADRLSTQGGPVEDWARLISALGVLGETAQAREIAAEAERVFAGDESALAEIAGARSRAGVAE